MITVQRIAIIHPAVVIWPFQYIIVRSSFLAAAGDHGHHHRDRHGAHDRAEDESRANDATPVATSVTAITSTGMQQAAIIQPWPE
jgi:hypothetical protein